MKKFLLGVALLAICAVCILVARTGNTVADRDITSVILLAPMGLYNCISAIKTQYQNRRNVYEAVYQRKSQSV